MVDWTRFRLALRKGNSQVDHLGRLQMIETWLDLSEEEALNALSDASKRDVSSFYYDLLNVVRLKVERESQATPTSQERLQQRVSLLSRLQVAARQAVGHPARLNGSSSRLREATAAIFPRVDRIAKSFAPEKPPSRRDMEELEQIIADYGQLEAGAPSDDPALSDLRWFKGSAAFILARTCVQLGQWEDAGRWFHSSARLFDCAGDARNAADCRTRAAELGRRLEAGLDGMLGASLRALTSSPSGPPSRAAGRVDLFRAATLVDLIGAQNAAGDVFEAARSAELAAKELADAGFKDPIKDPHQNPGRDSLAGDLTAAVNSWIAVAAQSTANLDFAECVLNVAKFYCAILGARVSQWIQPTPARSERRAANAGLADTLFRELQEIIEEMLAKWAESDAEVRRELASYEPGTDQASASPEDPGPSMQKQLRALDDALLEVRQTCNTRLGTPEPMDDLLQSADACRQQARVLGIPLYETKALLARAYVTGHLARGAETLAAAREARAVLLLDRADTLASLTQSFERTLYLEARSKELLGLQIAGDHENVLALCQETVRDFEVQRSRINSPFQEGPFLFAALPFYRMGAFAAFKLQRWDTMLDLLELVKARSSVRNRLGYAPPEQVPEDIKKWEEAFRSTSEKLGDLRRAVDDQMNDQTRAIATRRRWLWDMLAVARRRSSSVAPLPELSLAGLQATVAPDEAVIGYYWLADMALLVVLFDRDRLHVERIFLEPRDKESLFDLVDAVQGSAQNLDKEVHRLGAVLFPGFCRDFVATKRRLILSPNHSLHIFPFHAVTWDAEKFLGTRFTVRYVPNFSSLLLPWHSRCENRALAVAVRQCDIQPFSELENVEAEAEAIRAFYQARGIPVTVLKGEDACRETLERMRADRELSRYRWVHLGTHGESALTSADDPLESRLLLRRSQVDSMDIAGMGLDAEVVVLSACHTGQRAVRGRGLAELPGDEIFGLQSALFQSGVRTVMGTLWPVQVDAASAIVPAFHRGLAAGHPAEVALQAAVIDYLDHAEPKYCGMFYWAPFFISSMGTMATEPNTPEGG
jgi:CHAT domain